MASSGDVKLFGSIALMYARFGLRKAIQLRRLTAVGQKK